MRVLAVWIAGLVAFAVFGSLVGWALAKNATGEWAGVIAGTCAFVCVRLWR
jgi:hypothetical protein